MKLLARSTWHWGVAGAAGVPVMTVGERLERVITRHPHAYPTGAVADLLAAWRGPGPGRRHAAVAPGRRHDVAPPPAGAR